MKKWIIAAFVLLFAGCAVMAGVMYHLDFDFAKFSKTVYIENSVDITDDFSGISADISSELKIVPSGDGSCTVKCFVQKNIDVSAAVENGTLVIKESDNRDWYDRMDFSMSEHETGVTVFMPEKEYESLVVNTGYGDVAVPGGFSFGEAGIHTGSGDIEFRASVSGKVNMNSNSGDICVSNSAPEELNIATLSGSILVSSAEVAGNCNLKTDSGCVTVTDMTCGGFASKSKSGDLTATGLAAGGRMSVESLSGDVALSGCDAGEIKISTSSGDVAGTLLSEKIFVAQSLAGDVSVPSTSEGGRCEISSDSGDISMIVTQ